MFKREEGCGIKLGVAGVEGRLRGVSLSKSCNGEGVVRDKGEGCWLRRFIEDCASSPRCKL
jgi:hypothetical protein